MSLIYPMAERVKTRASITRLIDLAGEAKRSAERGLILPEVTEKGIIQLTGTSDRSRQVDALTSLGDELQKRHLEKLLPLAKDEFNAFCEYVSPDEPPASAWHVWLTEKLQEIEFNPDLGRFILNCPPGHAKPLHDDTPVLMADGSWVRLADVQVGDMVVSHKGAARVVEAVHDQGELPLLEVVTERGRRILSAPDHPFLVRRLGEVDRWVKAADLRPGDPLEIVGGVRGQLPDHSDQPVEMFQMAAYYALFGSHFIGKTPRGLPYSSFVLRLPTRNHAEFAHALSTKLGRRAHYTWNGSNSRFIMRLATADYKPDIDLLGLKTPARERRIPGWVFQGSAAKIAAYLQAVVRIRGHIPTRFAALKLHIRSKSPGYLQDLQRLFARLNIDSSLDDALLVLDDRAVEAMLAAGVTFNGHGDRKLEAKRKRKTGAYQTPSKPTDRVASVLPAGSGPCKCLTVREDHTFVADGVAVHNSTYASRLFVAWRLGRNPNLRIIGGGHSQRFVENEFSKKIRNLVSSPDFKRVFPDLTIDYSTRAADQWAIAGRTGQYAAKGVGQAVHGFRANFICVDDPYAKIEEAESPVQREKVNTWFTGDLGSRMLPFGKMFLIMTRFHEEDLTGHLMAMNDRLPEYARWHQVEAPALCIDPDTDIMGRKLGEVLWDYYDLSYFVTKKTEWSFQRFSLVYQQNPSAMSDSNVSGQFQFYDIAPHKTPTALKAAREAGQLDDAGRPKTDRREYFRKVICSVDTASKTTERADYSVIQTWGETHDRKYYLLRQTRVKVEINGLIEAIEKQARKDEVDAILVEDKGQGTAYIQARGKTEHQRRLAPAPVIPIDPKGQSKEFRFDEISPMITEGSVYLPQKAPWLDAFVKEVGQFPDGAHDDQVDAMSQALRYFKTHRKKHGSRKIGSFG